MTWPRCSELLRMDPAELAVFFPFLFLELPNPNLWPAEGAGPTLNLPENGHGYTPGLKVAEAVPSLHALLLKKLVLQTPSDRRKACAHIRTNHRGPLGPGLCKACGCYFKVPKYLFLGKV